MFGEKGFLGPIGDDLPSIIPLTFGLILFFSTFTFAFNSFESRNSYFNNSLAIASIAAGLRQDSYISGIGHFKKLCNGLNVSRIKYKAGIIALPENFADFKTIDATKLDSVFYSSDNSTDETKAETMFRCTNLSGTEDEIVGEPDFFSKNVLLRIYPVAVETHEGESASGFAVKPMLLVIATWQN